VHYFNLALASQPDYFDAHYNLGNALAAQGNFGGAADQFAEAVKLNPDDANAQANLGTALAQLGRLTEARLHYEAALRIDPSNQLARENLQQIEQMTKGTPH
jgi:Flp pilus assembly protein TadD